MRIFTEQGPACTTCSQPLAPEQLAPSETCRFCGNDTHHRECEVCEEALDTLGDLADF